MKQNTYSILAIALMTAALAVGCKKQEATETATTPESTPAEPAAPTPEPATAPPPEATATTPPPAETATEASAPAAMSFAQMDKNSDGSITPDELSDTDTLKQNFATADKDGNGKLSQSEFDAQQAPAKPEGK